MVNPSYQAYGRKCGDLMTAQKCEIIMRAIAQRSDKSIHLIELIPRHEANIELLSLTLHALNLIFLLNYTLSILFLPRYCVGVTPLSRRNKVQK